MTLAIPTHHGNPTAAAIAELTSGTFPFDQSTGESTYDRESHLWTFTGFSASASLKNLISKGTYSVTGVLAGSLINSSISVLDNGVEVTSYDFSNGPDFGLSFESSDTSGLVLVVSVDSGGFSLAGLRAYRSSALIGDPIPPNTETETAQQAVAPQTSGSYYSPPTGPLFDGDENTSVRFYTYAAGSSGATFDPPINFKAIELVATGTPGYSNEAGLFGGTAILQVDGEDVITMQVEPSYLLQRARVAREFTNVSEIKVVKPGGQRFLAREIYIYS